MAWLTQAVVVLLVISCTYSNPLTRFRRQIIPGAPICSQADVVFILDSSGSIGQDNWLKVLEFTKNIVRNFTEVGPRHTQVAVVSYATVVSDSFSFNQASNMTDVLAKIDALRWKDEETNTSGALWYARTHTFNQLFGARPRTPRLAIVVTDGKSNRDANLTIPFAEDLKSSEVVVFAVGVGNLTDVNELRGIATNNSYVYTVDNFDGLDFLKSQLAEALCEIPVECNRDADITFILDSSGSVSRGNFEKMKDFVVDLLELINVDGDTSNVGVITFGDTARIEFDLDDHAMRHEIQHAVRQIEFSAGTTNTAEALRMLREDMYIRDRGDRPDKQNIALLFTDGGSNNVQLTLDEAKRTRTAGITLVVIAVTSWINMNEVREMASDPDQYNVFSTTFSDISSIRNDLKSILCDQFNECNGDPCQNGGTCYNGVNKYECTCPTGTAGSKCQFTCDSVDVVVAVDSSGSIRENNYYTVLGFIKDFAENMNFNGDTPARMGLETFANSAEVKFNLDEYTTKDGVINAISFPYSGGTTNTAHAISTMRNAMFVSDNGDRPGVRNVGIIMTDGESDDRDTTFDEAAQARQDGIELLSVAINMRTERGLLEVRGIASDPDERNVFYAPSFLALNNFTDQLVQAVCNSIDECASDPCQGGGRCVDGMNGYTCVCPEGRSGINCERDCDGRADIVFIVDTSGSIRETRFKMVRHYIVSLIHELEVAQDKVRIGLITFSDEATEEFKLNRYTHSSDVIHAIEMMPYTRGRTATAAAIRMAYQSAFKEESGDRFDVPNYAIIITDGESTVEPEMTLPEAIEARIAGIHLIAVTVGPEANNLEIRGIASDPDEFNVHSVERFDDLDTKIMPLLNGMCDTVDECATNPCGDNGDCINGLGQYICVCDDTHTGVNCTRQCTRRADVVFVMDSSGSVEGNFETAQILARRIVTGLNFVGGRTRVGVATYSSEAAVMFHLNTYTFKEEVLNAITFTVDGRRTNTYSGINLMRSDMFTAINGDRNGDENWAIVITDGRSNTNQDLTVAEAIRAQNEDITIFAVGIGENGSVDRMEINGIASNPDNDYAYIMSSSELEEVANDILDIMCQ